MKKILKIFLCIGVIFCSIGIFCACSSKEKVVKSIEIAEMPEYVIKDRINISGAKIKVIYEDNSAEILDVVPSMFNKEERVKLSEVGEQDLTINYAGQSVKLNINIVEETYLLDYLIKKTFTRDFTYSLLQTTTQNDNTNVSNSFIAKYSVKENKYVQILEDGNVYIWINNDCMYQVTGDQETPALKDVTISKISDIFIGEYSDREILASFFCFEKAMLTNSQSDFYDVKYHSSSLTKDEDNNWVFIVKYLDDKYNSIDSNSYVKYTFTENEILSLERNIKYSTREVVIQVTMNYDKVNIIIPKEIKELESSALYFIPSNLEVHFSPIFSHYDETARDCIIRLEQNNEIITYLHDIDTRSITKNIDNQIVAYYWYGYDEIFRYDLTNTTYSYGDTNDPFIGIVTNMIDITGYKQLLEENEDNESYVLDVQLIEDDYWFLEFVNGVKVEYNKEGLVKIIVPANETNSQTTITFEYANIGSQLPSNYEQLEEDATRI